MAVFLLVLVLLLTAGCGDDNESTRPTNHTPVVSSVSVSPREVAPEGWATITVTASDPDEDPLTYSYQVSGGSIGAADPIAVWHAPATPGRYVVVATVRDPSGAAATGTDTLTVVLPNQAPVISQVTVNPASVNAGQPCSVLVTASDPDGDAMTYQYQGPGTILPNGAMATWTPPSVQRSHTVTVTARDPDQLTSWPMMGYVTVTVPQQQTGIRGTITAPAGVQVDLRNMLVRLYSSYGDYLADAPAQFVAAQGTEYSITFTFPNLPPGSTYYIDAWKDIDGNGLYTAGDVWSVYATGAWPNQTVAPVMVTQGNITDVTGGMVTFLL